MQGDDAVLLDSGRYKRPAAWQPPYGSEDKHKKGESADTAEPCVMLPAAASAAAIDAAPMVGEQLWEAGPQLLCAQLRQLYGTGI